MKACVNQCGDVAKHGPYCSDCANEGRAEKRGKRGMGDKHSSQPPTA